MAALIVPPRRRPDAGPSLALFLVYLVIITFAPVYHGVRVLETRGSRSGCARRFTPF